MGKTKLFDETETTKRRWDEKLPNWNKHILWCGRVMLILIEYVYRVCCKMKVTNAILHNVVWKKYPNWKKMTQFITLTYMPIVLKSTDCFFSVVLCVFCSKLYMTVCKLNRRVYKKWRWDVWIRAEVSCSECQAILQNVWLCGCEVWTVVVRKRMVSM